MGLWEEAGLTRAWNDPREEVMRKLAYSDGLFLVAVAHGAVIGTVMGGYDGHRGWVYSLAVSRAHRSRGVATDLMTELESRFRLLGCVKVNLQVRAENLPVVRFYQRLGYQEDHVIGLGKRLGPGS